MRSRCHLGRVPVVPGLPKNRKRRGGLQFRGGLPTPLRNMHGKLLAGHGKTPTPAAIGSSGWVGETDTFEPSSPEVERMRGRGDQQTTMLAFVDLEERVPRKHPLRVVKQFADRALRELSPVFDKMYAAGGRPSIPPERLLKASLLIALYSIRSETVFCEELDYQLLYRWFLDMGLLEPSFDPTVFTKNRRRLLKHDVAQRFFDEVVRQAAGLGLLSDQHFTVDGTLIEAAASLKSFRPKDKPPTDPPPDDPGNPTVNFHGQRRSNTTHHSTTDPEALLAKKGKGKEARLSFMGHALMENRNGLVVDFQLSQATGTAERDMAPKLVDQ